MFAAINSPWSANDLGDPLVILVEVDDKDDIPETLGKAMANEAAFNGQEITDEDRELAMSTLVIF